MKKDVDITETVAAGDLDYILTILKRYRKEGYDRLHWDRYDSTIHLYKSEDGPGVVKARETDEERIIRIRKYWPRK